MKRLFIILTALTALNASAQQYDLMGIPVDDENYARPEVQASYNKTTVELEEAIIINVIPSPTLYTADIAFDGELIWVNGYNTYQLFGVDPLNGDVVETIDISVQRPYGMTYHEGYIYLIDNTNKTVVKINRTTGLEEEVLALPENNNTYPTGLEISSGAFWYNDPLSPYAAFPGDLTRQFNCTGECYNTYEAVGGYPSGIASDGDYLWSTDNVSQTLYKVNKNDLSTSRAIAAPGGIYPNGLTSDGEFLWISNNDADSIYQIRVNEPTIDTGIKLIESGSDLVLYPTIANEYFNVESSIEMNNITIFNIKGQVIEKLESVNEKQLTVDTRDEWSNGTYICLIETEKGIIQRKFVINK
ncbi:MAG: T9SS type A sorting domain-containing protein [Bacteroidales bacterium]|nr:T9SS type A sorting domain-containing protein [Bacteroidales bacterium]